MFLNVPKSTWRINVDRVISLLAVVTVIYGNYCISTNQKRSIIAYQLAAICYMVLLRNDLLQVLLNIYMVGQGFYGLWKLKEVK